MRMTASFGRSETAPKTLIVRELGHRSYRPVWADMQAFTADRNSETPDELWLVEHDPVYTLGRAADESHVLAAGDIPVIRVDRGGQVTYHGPGQIVAYPLIDLRRRRKGVKWLVDQLEQAIIDRLDELGVKASRREKAPGVYVDDHKIGAIGLRVQRGCTFHGLAYNLDMDLEPFSRINPCGYDDLRVTSVARHAHAENWQTESRQLAETIALRLQVTAQFVAQP